MIWIWKIYFLSVEFCESWILFHNCKNYNFDFSIPEPQKTVEDNDTETEIYYDKADETDETDNTRLARLKRQPESLEEKEKSLEEKEKPKTPQPTPARVVEGTPSVALSNLQLSFQKQLCMFGITLGILYKMNKY